MYKLFNQQGLHIATILFVIFLSGERVEASQSLERYHASEETRVSGIPPKIFTINREAQADTIFKSDEIESKPEFPGGMEAFYKYLAMHFKYPKEARKNNVSGKQVMQFVVEKDGTLTNIETVKGLGSGLEKASILFLKESPKWKPGAHGGQIVRTLVKLPISFNISVEPSK